MIIFFRDAYTRTPVLITLIKNKVTKIHKFATMAKAIKKKTFKKRAPTYEPKVKFNGTFEEMIAISTTGAGAKKELKREKRKNS
ncbi:MAG: hypothetical protein WKF85_13800 [Chitinophagaceae bacterium]